MLSPGQTIWIPSGPAHDPQREHLHFVTARTVGPPAQIMLASLCSVVHGVSYDDATVLLVGDHPRIQRPSYINYRHTRIEREDTLERGLDLGQFRASEDCSGEILQRIRAGLEVSIFAAPFAKEFLRNNPL